MSLDDALGALSITLGENSDFGAFIVGSFDPNSKFGSLGSGPLQYLSGPSKWPYSVTFENDSTATAPAQFVSATDQLDPSFDLSTFSLGPFGFGSLQVVPPPGLSQYSTYVDMRPATNLLVAVNAGLNKSTRVATWTFQSLDPATGLPPTDALTGFLPPDVTPPQGDGQVLFSISPLTSGTTGQQIQNTASVIFDTNAAIATPAWFNTIDNTPPVSNVLPLPAQSSVSFTVSWQGTDVGSGVRDYTIYVSTNGGAFTPWLVNTQLTSSTYPGVAGSTYAFYSIARDMTLNLEPAKTAAEATTQVVVDRTPPVIVQSISGTLGQNGWYRGPVTVSWSVTDPESAIASSTGCAPTTLSIDTPGVTITCSATNGAGLSNSASVTIKIDQTPPVISVMPAGCTLRSEEDSLIRVATVSAADALSGMASFKVTGTSNEPNDPNDVDDIKIQGSGLEPRTIYLRANRLGDQGQQDGRESDHHDHRDRHQRLPKVYTLTATAMDLAGNTATTTSTCTVKRPSDDDRGR